MYMWLIPKTPGYKKFDSNGTFLTKWGSFGTGDGQFSKHVHGIAIDSKGNVYVTDRDNSNIQKFDGNGNFLKKLGSPGTGDGQFLQPHSTAIDSRGNLYVSDMNNFRIQKFDGNGNFPYKMGFERHRGWQIHETKWN